MKERLQGWVRVWRAEIAVIVWSTAMCLGAALVAMSTNAALRVAFVVGTVLAIYQLFEAVDTA